MTLPIERSMASTSTGCHKTGSAGNCCKRLFLAAQSGGMTEAHWEEGSPAQGVEWGGGRTGRAWAGREQTGPGVGGLAHGIPTASPGLTHQHRSTWACTSSTTQGLGRRGLKKEREWRLGGPLMGLTGIPNSLFMKLGAAGGVKCFLCCFSKLRSSGKQQRSETM